MTETKVEYVVEPGWTSPDQGEIDDLEKELDDTRERLNDRNTCVKELAGANHRLNERVRKLDYALRQCQEDKALLETQRDGARSWARNLLGRAENLDWLVERIGASWREDVAELKKELDEVKNGEIYEDELEHHCGQCGRMLEIVRPGKWQCPDCE